MNQLKTIVWRLLLGSLVASLGAVLIAGVVRTLDKDTYDYETSIAKLRLIGQKLQIYRNERGYLPVAQRHAFRDAGLPLSMTYLGLKRNMPWSTPNGLSDFQVAAPSRSAPQNSSHFLQPYWGAEVYWQLGDIASFFSSRGEQLPVLADTNMNSVEDIVAHPESLQAIVLRLNGDVEVVQWNIKEKHSILRK